MRPTPLARRLYVAAALCVAAIAAATLWWPQQPQVVPREPWTSAAAAAARRTPVILTSSPCIRWPAARQWLSNEYLSQRVPMLLDVVVSTPHRLHLNWNSDLPLADLLTQPVGAMVRQDLPSAELLRRIRAGEPLYYSSDLSHSDFGRLAPNDVPRRFLYVDKAAQSNSTSVWLGGHGVVTAAHYDTSHNFVAQLGGTKTFVLTPPASHSELRLHPWDHPLSIFAQQSSDLASTTVASLGPGDLLYVPPFYFHEVTAGPGISLSLNVWSGSEEGEVAEVLERGPPPPDKLFDATVGNPAERSALLAALVAALADEVLGEPVGFVKHQLLGLRWETTITTLNCSLAEMPPCAAPGAVAVGASERAQVEAHVAHVAATFAGLQNQQRGVRELLLLNMVETVVGSSLGLVPGPGERCPPPVRFYACLDS